MNHLNLFLLLFPFIFARRILESVPQHNPQNWTEIERADPSTPFNLIIALKQNNVHILEDFFTKVSDPDHELYGQYMSRESIHSILQPSQESISTVINWLASVGVTNFWLPTNDFLRVNLTVLQAESLLRRPYFMFEHSDGKKALRLSSPHYSVPHHVAPHIDFVSPTIRFPPTQKAQRHFQAYYETSPDAIRKLYNIGDTRGTNSKNKQAVTAFLEQYFSPSDQREFYRHQFNSGLGQSFTLKGDLSALKTSSAGVEAMLDSEYIVVTGLGVPTEFWAFSGRAPDNAENEPFLKWMIEVSATPDKDVPLLFSTSYGEDENSVTENYAERINIEFQKAGARGISLLFASGDSGAAGDDGCEGPNRDMYVSQWPAASPFVTAVGGTTIMQTSASGDILRERGASLSSGGFSNRYNRPYWQKRAVDGWFKNRDIPRNHIANKRGRAFPDMAALATGYTVVANGDALPQVAGTSCSTPVVAGIFSLLNDLRLSQGRPPLGFLNPFIYRHPEAFNDIVDGHSSGCKFTSMGYNTRKGWDPVTGLGTPDYQKLATAVRNLKK